MKKQKEIQELINSKTKIKEKQLDIKIRNGQALEAIKKTLLWVLSDNEKINNYEDIN